jgi:hypothetical protein
VGYKGEIRVTLLCSTFLFSYIGEGLFLTR